MIPDATTAAGKTVNTILWAAILAAPVACDPAGSEARGPIADDTYVLVMSELADLRRFPPGGRDQASRDSAADSVRRAVLDRYGVTVDELLSFAEIVGEQPARMVDISERISAVTDSLAELRRQDGRTGAADTTDVADTTDAAVAGAPDTAASADTARAATVPNDTTPGADERTAPRRIEERDAALRQRIDRPGGRRDGVTP